jgi:hypothetical protein
MLQRSDTATLSNALSLFNAFPLSYAQSVGRNRAGYGAVVSNGFLYFTAVRIVAVVFPRLNSIQVVEFHRHFY